MQTRAAVDSYFGHLLLAASPLAKKKLILETDPAAALAMGLRLMMFPPAIAAAMLAALWEPWAGFYAMLLVLLGMRIWNRQRFHHAQSAGAAAAKP